MYGILYYFTIDASTTFYLINPSTSISALVALYQHEEFSAGLVSNFQGTTRNQCSLVRVWLNEPLTYWIIISFIKISFLL